MLGHRNAPSFWKDYVPNLSCLSGAFVRALTISNANAVDRPATPCLWRMAAVRASVPEALTAALILGILHVFSEPDEVNLAPASGSMVLMLVSLVVVYGLLNFVVIRLGLGLCIKLIARENSVSPKIRSTIQ